MTRALNVLGVAAKFNRISFVFFRHGDLGDWGDSYKGGKGIEGAYIAAEKWIRQYKPSLVVVPDYYGHKSRKGDLSRARIEAIVAAAEAHGLAVVRVQRPHRHRNKHREALMLANRYRQIEGWVPKYRRAWDDEPRTTLMFEALAVTHAYLMQCKKDASQ